MIFDGFVGESYTARALAFDAQRTLNLYLEADESGKGASNAALLGTPGLTLLQTLPTYPVRGIWTGLISQLPGTTGTDLCFVVAGSKLYEVYSNNSYTLIGDVGDDAAHSPVQFEVNGGQLLISSAGYLWVQDGAGLNQAFFNNGTGTVNTSGTAVTYVSGNPFDSTQVGSYIRINGTAYLISSYTDELHITLSTSAGTQTGSTFYVLTGAGSTPVYVSAAQVAFLDGYFIALPHDSTIFYISGLQDGRNWNPLDYGRKSAFPDAIAGVLADHEELWLFGSETTEVWRDTGDANFPFQRDPGAFIHQGIRAPFSAVNLANGVAWIGGDARGTPIAWRAEGYLPARISTHAIEQVWGQYATVADVTAYVYTEDGHQFWVLNFPTANATWVYDATSATWHERGWWNGTSIDRQRQTTHGFVFGQHVVGDWQTGNLYAMSLTAYTDNGTQIVRIRTAPHLTNEELWTFYSRFRVGMMGGPNPTLAWSDDLGQTFNTPRAGSGRRISSSSDSTSQVSEWRRLGRGRDRIFRLQITDAVQIAITAAYIDMSGGNG